MSSIHYRLTREESYLLDHLRSLIDRAAYSERIVFTDFIAPNLLPHVNKILQDTHIHSYEFHDDGTKEYQMLAFSQTQLDSAVIEWPVKLLRVEVLDNETLTHRQVLGSLMALGFKRDKIGDILLSQSSGVVFVTESMAKYVVENMTSVGSTSAIVSYASADSIAAFDETSEQVKITVASMRLDLVVSKIFSMSRNDAQQLFRKGRIKYNHGHLENYKKSLSEGDLISVRGYGRIQLIEISSLTRKGNISALFRIFR